MHYSHSKIVMRKPSCGSRPKLFKTREGIVMKYIRAKFQVDPTKIVELRVVSVDMLRRVTLHLSGY